MASTDFKIIAIQTENFMNIRLAGVELNGESMIITGDNEAGKSSLINSILSALEGLKVDEPIRKGSDKAEINIVIGDEVTKFNIKQVYTAKGERLEVTTPDGAQYGSPRKFLERFINFIAIDPVELANLFKSKTKDARRKARDIVMQLTDLQSGNLEDAIKEYNDGFEQIKSLRSEQLQQVKYVEAKIKEHESFIDLYDEIPSEEIQSSDILELINQQNERSRKHGEYTQAAVNLESQIKDCDSQILSNKNGIVETKKEIDRLLGEIEELKKGIDICENDKRGYLEQLNSLVDPGLPTLEEQESVQNELKNIEEKNKMIRAKKTYLGLVQQCEDAKDLSRQYLTKMNDIEKGKMKMLSQITFPVAGLSIDEEGVLYNNVPINQSSDSALLRISTSILMAQNPKLKTIIIRNGNDFTAKNLKAIMAEIENKGYQVLVEKCDDSGKIGLYIEDGTVKTVNGNPVINKEIEEHGTEESTV